MKQLLTHLKQRGLTITTAESCTGGLLAGTITDISGASEVFQQGYITYSNEAKHRLLNVPNDILKRVGAVSAETAQAMAEGALKNAYADIALVTTGIAGPTGGTPEKPVGTVYIAIASKETPTVVKHLTLTGSRETIRKEAVAACLTLALETVT